MDQTLLDILLGNSNSWFNRYFRGTLYGNGIQIVGQILNTRLR